MGVAASTIDTTSWLLILAIAATFAAATWLTAGKLGWKRVPRGRAAGIALAVVLVLTLLPTLGAGVATFVREAARPGLASLITTAIVEPHNPTTRTWWLTFCLVPLAISIAGFIATWRSEKRVWWLAFAAIFAGLTLGYLGVKVFDKENGLSLLSLAIAGYLLSLSSNFLSSAMTPNQSSAEATIAALGPKLKVIENNTEEIKQSQREHREENKEASQRIERLLNEGFDALTRSLDASMPPSIPKELVELGRLTEQSKDAETRIKAKIVQARGEEARQEIAAARQSKAFDHVFNLHMLEGDSFYFESKFDEAIPPYEAAFALRPNEINARNSLAIALTRARRGDRPARLRRAIYLHTGTLALPGLSKYYWAGTKNNLGLALADMPFAAGGENLRLAIDAFNAALNVFTKDTSPMDWAATQNNLGNTLADMPTGDRGENLRQAIDAYTEALKVFTKDAAPMDWAMTQNNLASALAQMPTGDPGQNLSRAIKAYTSALTIYTKDAAPMEWAMTQNNLGNTLVDMPTGDRGENLRRGIEAYAAAFSVWTKAAAPMDWATTHSNLAGALADLAEQAGEDRCDLLRRAIASSKGALTVLTPAVFPHHHAATSGNLAFIRARYESLPCSQPPSGVPFDAIAPAE